MVAKRKGGLGARLVWAYITELILLGLVAVNAVALVLQLGQGKDVKEEGCGLHFPILYRKTS